MPPRPLYQQVKQFIEERIHTGDWPQDSKIPSENELVNMLNVSRMTINRALRELTAAGHLVRVQGVGTFVAPQKPQSALLEIQSIAQEIRERGGQHSSEIHLLTAESAEAELAAAMNLVPETQVFHAILVHKDRETPIQLADRYVNPAIAPDFLKQDFMQTTPSEYLLKVAPVSAVEHVIEAILPDEQMQRLLEIRPAVPCLLLHRKTWVGDMVATKSRFIYPGTRYRLGGRFRPASVADRVIT